MGGCAALCAYLPEGRAKRGHISFTEYASAQRVLDSICTSDTMALQLRDPYSVSDKATRRLALRLALKGHARTGAYAPSIHADWSVYCDAPVTVYRAIRAGKGRRSMEVSFPAPCRKCEKCLRFRRMRWRQRIINEILTADDAGRRSWMITLTFAPVHLAGVLLEAQALQRRGKPRPEAIEQAAYGHVQKYIKRLRKNTRKSFRYIAVPEYGEENGRLHYHLILSESDSPVLKLELQKNWRSFSNAKLVDASGNRGIAGAASYVSKYIAKGEGRPRASAAYGAVPPALSAG